MKRLRACVGVVLVAVSLGVASCGDGSTDGAGSGAADSPIPGPYDHDFTIPEGTAARIAAGDDVEVLPPELDAKVGETIRIVNDDVKSHTIGSFYVLAGTTLTYRFSTTGVFQGECSTHRNNQFVLKVTA